MIATGGEDGGQNILRRCRFTKDVGLVNGIPVDVSTGSPATLDPASVRLFEDCVFERRVWWNPSYGLKFTGCVFGDGWAGVSARRLTVERSVVYRESRAGIDSGKIDMQSSPGTYFFDVAHVTAVGEGGSGVNPHPLVFNGTQPETNLKLRSYTYQHLYADGQGDLAIPGGDYNGEIGYDVDRILMLPTRPGRLQSCTIASFWGAGTNVHSVINRATAFTAEYATGQIYLNEGAAGPNVGYVKVRKSLFFDDNATRRGFAARTEPQWRAAALTDLMDEFDAKVSGLRMDGVSNVGGVAGVATGPIDGSNFSSLDNIRWQEQDPHFVDTDRDFTTWAQREGFVSFKAMLNAVIAGAYVLDYPIYDGTTPYGLPRWFSRMTSVLGVNEANRWNLDFFRNNCIPAAVLMVAGGMVTQESLNDLKGSLGAARGIGSAQRIWVVEAEADDTREGAQAPRMTFQVLQGDRQQDANFLAYIKHHEGAIKESYRLPPLYLGASQDYTYATAKTSQAVAEAQIFRPERAPLEDRVNRMLATRGVRFWRFRLLAPEIADNGEMLEAMKLAHQIGALTPNAAIGLVNRI